MKIFGIWEYNLGNNSGPYSRGLDMGACHPAEDLLDERIEC